MKIAFNLGRYWHKRCRPAGEPVQSWYRALDSEPLYMARVRHDIVCATCGETIFVRLP